MNRKWLQICTASALLGSSVSARTQYWVPTSAPCTNWGSVACSSDGARLVAASFGSPNDTRLGGLIYVSADAGAHWTQTPAPTNKWAAVASSADGTRLIAVAGSWEVLALRTQASGPIFTSTNAGATWVQTTAPVTAWVSVVSSADGMKLAASSYYAGLWTSADGGNTWNTSAAPFGDAALAMSADGNRLAAALVDVYTSTNFAATWTKCTPATGRWFSVASSADGLKLAVGAGYSSDVPGNYCPIYTSVDGGANWTRTPSPSAVCNFISSSADGSKLAAVYGGHIYLSGDAGASWTDSVNPVVGWSPVAMTSDGSRMTIGASMTGGIYSLQHSPRLDVSRSGTGLLFSWPAYSTGSGLGPPRDPTTNVVLQATGDIGQVNWTNFGIGPLVTNLSDQFLITSPPDRAFYRLKGS